MKACVKSSTGGGVDYIYMSWMERGVRNTSVLKLAAIARALRIPMAALFQKDRRASSSQARKPPA